MLKLTLITIGNLKEKYLREASAEYEKRLGAYCSPQIIELKEERLPDSPSDSSVKDALAREGAVVLSKINPKSYVIALAVEGKSFTSEKLAEHIKDVSVRGYGEITLIIGSSHGLSPEVKKRADLLLSVSSLTFPHQLMRPLTLEVMYRCLSILAGSRYHK